MKIKDFFDAVKTHIEDDRNGVTLESDLILVADFTKPFDPLREEVVIHHTEADIYLEDQGWVVAVIIDKEQAH